MGRAVSQENFKLPRSSYGELARIIQGYAELKSESTLAEVAQAVGLNPTTVSYSNAFLVQVGIISIAGKKKKCVTGAGTKLGNALQNGINSEIEENWRDIVLKNSFLANMVSFVKIRKEVGIRDLRAHIISSSGQSQGPTVTRGSLTILTILEVAGLVTRKDGKVVLAAYAIDSPAPDSLVEALRHLYDAEVFGFVHGGWGELPKVVPGATNFPCRQDLR